LYVLILAILGPLLTKESKKISKLLSRFIKWEANSRAIHYDR
jgi:CPA2 family monovalent cation:H+ antiporter-2